MRIVGLVPDLMDQSRITNVAPDTTFVAKASELQTAASGADFVLLDLTRDGAVDSIPSIPCRRIVGFANHTSKDLLAAATAAGAITMVRSDFFIRLEELLLGNPS